MAIDYAAWLAHAAHFPDKTAVNTATVNVGAVAWFRTQRSSRGTMLTDTGTAHQCRRFPHLSRRP